MENNRKGRKYLILFLSLILLNMSIAFASFSQKLIITGTANVISGGWNIAFDDIVSLSTSGYATGSKGDSITEKNITFSCEFLAPNDSCELSFSIVNQGTIDALLTHYDYTVTSNGEELYSGKADYDDQILNISLSAPDWTEESTVLNPSDKGNFAIKTTLKDMSSLSETVKYIITISFDFEQK